MNLKNTLKMKCLQKILVVFFMIFNCYQCTLSCLPHGFKSIDEEFNYCDYVFTGRVISHKTFLINDTNENKDNLFLSQPMYQAEFFLVVSEIFKGFIKFDTIRIVTGIGGGDCGFDFIVDREYLIYSRFKDKYYDEGMIIEPFLYTDIHYRTYEINQAEIVEIRKLLGKKVRK